MNYKNEKHRELFGEAVRRKDKKDYELNTIVGKEPQSYDNSSTDLDQNGQDNTAETRIFR